MQFQPSTSRKKGGGGGGGGITYGLEEKKKNALLETWGPRKRGRLKVPLDAVELL